MNHCNLAWQQSRSAFVSQLVHLASIQQTAFLIGRDSTTSRLSKGQDVQEVVL